MNVVLFETGIVLFALVVIYLWKKKSEIDSRRMKRLNEWLNRELRKEMKSLP